MLMFKEQKGFTLIECLLIVLIIVIIVFGGYYVYQSNHAGGTALTSGTHKSINHQSAVNNYYAGWKTYCDTQAKVCLQYPFAWTVGSFNGIGISSPHDNTVVYESPTLGSCVNKTPSQIGINNFYVISINKVTHIQNLEIVGGYQTTGTPLYQPTYILTNVKYVNEFGATVGSIVNFPNTAWTCFDHGVISASIQSIPNGPNSYSGSALEAQTWFKTTSAKSALQIIQSVYSN